MMLTMLTYDLLWLTIMLLLVASVVSFHDAARWRRIASDRHRKLMARGDELIAAYNEVTRLANELTAERAAANPLIRKDGIP